MNWFSLLIILFSLILCYLIGHVFRAVIFKEYSSNKFFNVFVNLLIGFISIIFVYALIKTSSNTILWGFLILIFLFYYRKNLQKPSLKSIILQKNLMHPIDIPQFSIALIICSGFFFLQGYFFYNLPYNNLPQGDYAFYSMVVDYIRLTGIESYIGAEHPFKTFIDSPVPYHYTEIWASAFFVDLFKINTIESQVVIVHSLLGAILSTGLISLIKLFNNTIIFKIFSLFSVFLTGIIIYRFLPQTDSFIFAIGWNSKLIIISIFLVWFFYLLKIKSHFFYFPLLAIPIVNIATAPTIFTSLFCFVFIELFFKKAMRQVRWHILIDTLLTATFIASFYIINSKSNASGDFTLNNIISGLQNDIKKPFLIIAGSLIIFLSIYILHLLPFIVIMFTKLRTNIIVLIQKQSLERFIPIIMFIFGLVFWSVSNNIVDSIQFFYLTALLPFNILLLIIYAYFSKILNFRKKIWSHLFVIYFFILIAINLLQLKQTPFYRFSDTTDTYSEEYLNSIVSKIDTKNSNKLIGIIRNSETIDDYWEAVSSYGQIYYLHLFFHGYRAIPLDVMNIDINKFQGLEKQRIQSYIKETDFYCFYQEKLDKSASLPVQFMQEEFVTANNISMLVLDERSLVYIKNFQHIVDTVISDQKSGQNFVFLEFE